LLVGIAVLSMVGILVGITVQAIFYLGYFLQKTLKTLSSGDYDFSFA
jgi:hypothetical protein